ncbi:siderophore-interacting protein [Rhodobacter capsulatus]|uniref:Siderophore-interacting protein n=1 Tax=Rhodobacter capsulatus TaxID=1061 RepID=A0A4U1JLJ2_RHOCA|nr:siderophore-interacting protein [Rhodobacter capsulatus]TKD14477.1 siderophore-interacting protein [Rhodobacter capsulatus]
MIQLETQLALPQGATVLQALRAHALEHEIAPEIDTPDAFAFSFQGNRLSFRLSVGRLCIGLTAVSPNTLYFLKETVAHHLEELAPAAAAQLRWPDPIPRHPPNFRLLRVTGRMRPCAGLTRLELAGGDLDPLTRDGLHVKLMRPADPGRAPVWPGVAASGATRWPEGADRLHVRYFTLRAVDPVRGRVLIDFVDHPGGQISDWARRAAPGDEIGVMGPGGGLLPGTGRPLILLGDLTALPAMARILESLPCGHPGQVIAALPEGADYLPADRLDPVFLPPDRFAEDALAPLAQALALWPGAHLWVGAEQRMARAARDLAAALPAAQKEIGSYWRKGQRGDARRETHDDDL